MFVHRGIVGIPVLEILRDAAGVLHPGKLELCCHRLVLDRRICGKPQPRDGDRHNDSHTRKPRRPPFGWLQLPPLAAFHHNLSGETLAFELPWKIAL